MQNLYNCHGPHNWQHLFFSLSSPSGQTPSAVYFIFQRILESVHLYSPVLHPRLSFRLLKEPSKYWTVAPLPHTLLCYPLHCTKNGLSNMISPLPCLKSFDDFPTSLEHYPNSSMRLSILWSLPRSPVSFSPTFLNYAREHDMLYDGKFYLLTWLGYEVPSYLSKHYFLGLYVRVFLDKISTWINRMSKAGGPP